MVNMLLKFVNYLRENLVPSDDNDSTILKWVELALNICSDCDLDLDEEVTDYMEALNYVKNNFASDVFQQSLRYADICGEIVNCAFCFNAGYSEEEVDAFAEEGWLECGYYPNDEDKTGNLILVKILDPENNMLLFSDVSEKIVLRTIGRASTEAINEGGTVSGYIQKGIVCEPQNVCLVSSPPLKKAFEKALENNTAVDRVITFNPKTGEVDFFENGTKLHSDIEIDEAPSELGMNLT